MSSFIVLELLSSYPEIPPRISNILQPHHNRPTEQPPEPGPIHPTSCGVSVIGPVLLAYRLPHRQHDAMVHAGCFELIEHRFAVAGVGPPLDVLYLAEIGGIYGEGAGEEAGVGHGSG